LHRTTGTPNTIHCSLTTELAASQVDIDIDIDTHRGAHVRPLSRSDIDVRADLDTGGRPMLDIDLLPLAHASTTIYLQNCARLIQTVGTLCTIGALFAV
jgi:hypothetical protein